jgi:hypothetical protein
MEVMVRVASPVFVSVMDWVGLTVSANWLPKSTEVGEKVTMGPATLIPTAKATNKKVNEALVITPREPVIHPPLQIAGPLDMKT